MLGGGGGGFYSSGRSSKQFGGSTGFGGEGGKGFLQGGVGGKAKYNNAEVSEEAAVLMEMEGVVEAEAANESDSCGGGGGSYNAGKNQQSDCCYKTAGHGQVTITFI